MEMGTVVLGSGADGLIVGVHIMPVAAIPASTSAAWLPAASSESSHLWASTLMNSIVMSWVSSANILFLIRPASSRWNLFLKLACLIEFRAKNESVLYYIGQVPGARCS